MRQKFDRALGAVQGRLSGFSVAQKVSAGIGVVALVVGGVLVTRWATAPTFAPLYSDMTSADASAIIDELTAAGVPYELSADGGTVMVPREQVHATRIDLSAAGLPAGSTGGYSLLDDQSLSTSQFQEQTSFKRAMEGELATTVEAIDGVTTAVVHLALPAKQVFAKEQDPATASVLVDLQSGATFGPDQVQAVVHLVASSVDGLSPEKVTVADSTGQVLSENGQSGAGSGARNRALTEYQDQLNAKIQAMLDKVVGPGNSTVAVTADLDFDTAVRTSTSYESDPETDPISRSEQVETYSGSGAEGTGGVVGPEGNAELDRTGEGDGNYRKRSITEDNAVDSVVERRETAPGSVNSLHIGVALDSEATQVSSEDMRDLIAGAIGEDLDRGDTVEVTSLPFDRAAAEAAQAELTAAKEAEEAAARNGMIRNGLLVALVVAALLGLWIISRRRARARAEATEYVVEQLRAENEARAGAPATDVNPAVALLEDTERDEVEKMRDELSALVERQPEDVAALLRGWLVEPTR